MVAFDLRITQTGTRAGLLLALLLLLNDNLNGAHASPLSLRSQIFNQLTVPASIGTSSGEAASCTDLLLQAASASECRTVANNTEVKVVLCMDSFSHGHVLMFPGYGANSSNSTSAVSTAASRDGQRIYRLRIVGPEVLLPPIRYCQAAAVSKYALETNGTWHFEVLLLYNNFTFPPPPRVRSDVHAANFTVTVADAIRNQSTCLGKECALCRSHSMPGRWVVNHQSVFDTLKSTCAKGKHRQPNCTAQIQTGLAKDTSGMLVWRPYTCRYQKFHHPAVAAQCLAKLQKEKPLCIVGDSQMRHMHAMVVQLLNASAADTFSNLLASRNGATVKTVLASNVAKFISDSYGGWHDTSACSHVFVNFGQWPLSFATWKHPTLYCAAEGCHKTAPGEPWSLGRYAAQVEKVAQHMVEQRLHHNNTQYWVTINTQPIILRWHQEEGYDWRSEPMLLTYNKVANMIMQRHGIPIVDTYSISSPVNDLSYDNAHYIGNVGFAQARMLLHTVCPGN